MELAYAGRVRIFMALACTRIVWVRMNENGRRVILLSGRGSGTNEGTYALPRLAPIWPQQGSASLPLPLAPLMPLETS